MFPPPPRLIIIGAVHAAIPLITFAKELGFRTTVVDPRSAFATPQRFAHADELIVKWPQEALSASDFNEGTYLVALSHDEKLDNPALKLALESPCRYIGASVPGKLMPDGWHRSKRWASPMSSCPGFTRPSD